MVLAIDAGNSNIVIGGYQAGALRFMTRIATERGLEADQYAVQLAESLMDSRDSVYESGWNESGESNGFQWNIQSGPFKTDVGEAPNIPPLHEVRIVVSWSDGDKPKSFELSTLRAQRRPPDPAESGGAS